MSIIVILNFAVDDDYIYFSVQQCTVNENHCFIVGFHFYGYAVCVLHVVLKHFRENKRTILFFFFSPPPPPTCSFQLISCGPYFNSLPLSVAVVESRHGTTHCLNTVDRRKWSQETHPDEKERATIESAPHKRSSHPDRPPPYLLTASFLFSDEPHLALAQNTYSSPCDCVTAAWILTLTMFLFLFSSFE